MTTQADIVRIAEEIRASGVVYREPSGYVSIQQSPPYDDGRFGTGWVEHCGITGAYIYTVGCGLTMGVHYPSGIQYSPLLARQILTEGYATAEPEPGGIGVVDWGAAGYGQAWAADHVVLIIEPRPDTVVVLDANTTPDGRLYYHEYPRSWFVAWGLPKGLTVAPPPPDPAEVQRQWARLNPPPILLGVQS